MPRAKNQYQRRDTVSRRARMALHLPRRAFEIAEEPVDDDPEHPSISMFVQPPLKAMDMSAMTKAELDAFREFINAAIDMAEPIAADLDRLAQEEAQAGRGIWKRLFRPDPKLVRFDKQDTN